jgi:glycosyltransferase involved in cell wall biosynthesis
MLEALACGKPIVSTDVSGARDMIVEGANGFVVDGCDPKRFAETMVRALSLREHEQTSLRIAERYAPTKLAKDLGILWSPLA